MSTYKEVSCSKPNERVKTLRLGTNLYPAYETAADTAAHLNPAQPTPYLAIMSHRR